MADHDETKSDEKPRFNRDEHFTPAGKFAPGNPGGPGRPKMRPFREALRKRLLQHPEELEAIVETLMGNALGRRRNRFEEVVNEIEAAAFIRDTVEGRPSQAVEISGPEDEDGLPTEIVVRVVEPNNK